MIRGRPRLQLDLLGSSLSQLLERWIKLVRISILLSIVMAQRCRAMLIGASHYYRPGGYGYKRCFGGGDPDIERHHDKCGW